jgi:hypothetical protein
MMRKLELNEVQSVSGGFVLPAAFAGAAISSAAYIGSSMISGTISGQRLIIAAASGFVGGGLGSLAAAHVVVWRLNIAFAGGISHGVLEGYDGAGGKIGTVSVSDIRLVTPEESRESQESSNTGSNLGAAWQPLGVGRGPFPPPPLEHELDFA